VRITGASLQGMIDGKRETGNVMRETRDTTDTRYAWHFTNRIELPERLTRR
jgi:hypothetical protein